MNNDSLPAWKFDSSQHLDALVEVAQALSRPPDIRLRILSSTGDTITALVMSERAAIGPGGLLYVRRFGAYEVLELEAGPGGRAFLTLGAWPSSFGRSS